MARPDIPDYLTKTGREKDIRQARIISRILLGVVITILGISAYHFIGKTPRREINYRPTTICPDAFEKDVNHSEDDMRYVDVPLQEGCFGGFVRIPKHWQDWHAVPSPVSPQDGFWVAYWPENEGRGRGPYFANDRYDFTWAPARLQGHGTIRFYSNTAVAVKESEATRDAQPGKELPPGPPLIPIPPVQVKDLRFDMKGCNRSLTKIYCEGTVTNTAARGNQVLLRTCLDSIVVISTGCNEYLGDQAIDDLGNRLAVPRQTFFNGPKDELQPNLPVKFFMTFEDPDMNAKKVSVVVGLWRDGNVLMRDIPLVPKYAVDK